MQTLTTFHVALLHVLPTLLGNVRGDTICSDKPICSLCDWTEWTNCSTSCGGGVSIRERSINRPNKWTDNETKLRCKQSQITFEENKTCNALCFNGGSLQSSSKGCLCSQGFSGICCEKTTPMLFTPFKKKERAHSFLKPKNRVRRSLSDLNIDEECEETGGCDREEVWEYLHYHKRSSGYSSIVFRLKSEDLSVLCNFMRNRKCGRHSCFAGQRCATRDSHNCEEYNDYEVTCYDVNECASNPCRNGATCNNLWNRYTCTCDPHYYGRNCEYRCHVPLNCVNSTCTNSNNYVCNNCQNQGSSVEYSLYWPTTDRKVCQATCSWKENWCWPGECSSHLAKNCVCKPEFYKTGSLPAGCDLRKKADLVACRLGAESKNGRVVNSTSHGPGCSHEEGAYMNFQTENLYVSFTSEFSIANYTWPMYISDFQMGLVGAEANVTKVDLYGKIYHLRNIVLSSSKCDRVFSQTNPLPATPVTCKLNANSDSLWLLRNGEQICMRVISSAGGFLRTKDFHHNNSTKKFYTQTKNDHDVCMRYDSEPPVHCSFNNSCSEDVLQTSDRVLENPYLTVGIEGWYDPFPVKPEQASKIKSVSLSVHGTIEVDNSTLMMNEASLPDMVYNVSDRNLNISLPGDKPGLYGLVLEVVDTAKNVRRARRLVMFDNSSRLLIRHDKVLRAYTADSKTNYTWQTNLGNVCMSWHGRYYNSFQVNYNLLRKVQQDYHGFFTGIYEQTTGVLPVSGTPNVGGIVDFQYNWTKVGKIDKSYPQSITKVTDEMFCENLHISDGETLMLSITSVDIMRRTLTESSILYVDSSAPDINDMWILKDGFRQLFVHNSTELHKMVIEFSIMDIHSGIYSIEWQLGTTPTGHELGMQAMGVQRLPKGLSCIGRDNCYCPSIGSCEIFLYRANFNSLVINNTHIGLHNREYFFTVKATNNAQLVNIERTDILVDNSPPEDGVIFEGTAGEKDIDYTSDPTLFLNWHGFIDHESGIKKYRVGIDEQCMTLDQLMHDNHNESEISQFIETTEMVTKFALKRERKFYATIIAYNHALQQSKPVCTDGIVFDTTPPKLENIILTGARVKEVIAYVNDSAQLVMGNLTVVELKGDVTCKTKCSNGKTQRSIQHMYTIRAPSNDSAITESMCTQLPCLSNDWNIYLPSDEITITWQVTDNESQIRDVYVGISSEREHTESPDIEGYVHVRRMSRYTNTHSGLDRGIPFYIMIKAKNKADLESIVPLGPVIIDETPPQYNGGLQVLIKEEFAYIVWQNESFYDIEQKDEISNVLFRVVQDSTYMTPHLQGEVLKPCPIDMDVSCVKYPLVKLQQLDSEKGIPLLFELSIFNTAGLHVIVKSPIFIVPSRFPPSEGIVLDTAENSRTDIDFIRVGKEICVTWFGFHHQETVTFEVGVGSGNKQDDILPFTVVNDTTFCLMTDDFSSFRRHFSVVRVTSSTGSIIASSDGFVPINENSIRSNITVTVGEICTRDTLVESVLNSSVDNFKFKYFMNTNTLYTLSLNSKTFNSPFDVNSIDVIWMKSNIINGTLLKQFIPMTGNPTFSAKVLNKGYTVDLLRCGDIGHSTNRLSVPSYWSVPNVFESFVSHYFATLVQRENNIETCVTDVFRVDVKKIVFKNLTSAKKINHSVKIQACFDTICLPASYSLDFIIEFNPPIKGNTVATQLEESKNCTEIAFEIEPYKCDSGEYAKGYTVKMALDITGFHTIHDSASLANNEDAFSSRSLKIKRCLNIPVYRHRSLYACIKGTCSSGSSLTSCTSIRSSTHFNEFDINVVYEVNADEIDLSYVRNLLSSTFIGEKLTLLHNEEIDFVKPIVRVFGLMRNPNGRKIDWYIMTKNQLPTLTCEEDLYCVLQSTSVDGIGYFKRAELFVNVKYFICANSSAGIIEREYHVEHLPEIRSCGNGFIVDSDAPKPGKVEIKANQFGFIDSSAELFLSWFDFTDIEYANDLENYKQGIASYSYSLGTYPGGTDVVSFSNVGLETNIMKGNLTLRNGIKYYASVQAKDHVGHVTTVISPGVVLDTTPPSCGVIWIGNGMNHRYLTSIKGVRIYWSGFDDPESGIAGIRLGVGSTNQTADIVEMHSVSGENAQISDVSQFIDGHQYFIILTVHNYAGLFSRVVSDHFIVDHSPPVIGVVVDGNSSQTNLEYQFDITTLSVHWNGFSDQHSGLAFYEVGVGSAPGSTDVMSFINVGLRTSHSWNSVFQPGVRYYSTVRACNKVTLCSTAISNGIVMDNSPPIPGIIHVGLSDRHQNYLGHRSTISARWIGFQDPHSGLSHFYWCVGRSPNLCDIEKFQNVHLSDGITKTGLYLPLDTNLYVTVKAFNNIGLSVERSSDAFRIDVTAPLIVSKPLFVTDGALSLKPGTQFDNSLLLLQWEFQDDESPILENTLFLHTHDKGHIVKQISTYRNQNSTMISLDRNELLKDGDTYTAWVIACNAAGLCNESKTELLLIDSSPPHLGGFKNVMNWEIRHEDNITFTTIHLRWYGFIDVESNISHYLLAVSKTFSGSELSNGTITATHNSSAQDQTIAVSISEILSVGQEIVLSVSAVNMAGLRSATGRMTVTLVASDHTGESGFLEIQRHSCRSHYCNNDCTCAVLGQKCLITLDHNSSCTGIKNKTDELVAVFGTPSRPMSLTKSKSCLVGFWNVKELFKVMVLRYEWTMGIMDEDPGAGVFDGLTENIWYDVEKYTSIVHCLRNGKYLVHGESYALHIRAWISSAEYFEYSSLPILVDHSSPAVRRGEAVIESDETCLFDLDYLNSTDDFAICWSSVFSEEQGRISSYSISGGTSYGGDDFIKTTNIRLNTTFRVDGSRLHPGTRYYFTVTATNDVGLSTSKTSDGILVDLDRPVAGVVYNTRHHKSIRYQSSVEKLGISWHGFDDHQSYLAYYTLSVFDTRTKEIIAIQDALGVQNSFIFENLQLRPDINYAISVTATDAVGHVSDVATSDEIIVDYTPPLGFICANFTEQVLIKTSDSRKDEAHNYLKLSFDYSMNISTRTIYKMIIVTSIMPHDGTLYISLAGHDNLLELAKDSNGSGVTEYIFNGESDESLSLTIYLFHTEANFSLSTSLFNCDQIRPDEKNALSVRQVSIDAIFIHSLVYDFESGIKSIDVGIGTTENGFQVQTFTPLPANGLIKVDVPHNSDVFVQCLIDNNAGLRARFRAPLFKFDKTPPDVYNCTISAAYRSVALPQATNLRNYFLNISMDDPPYNSTSYRTVTDIKVRWHVEDLESGLQTCECIIGNDIYQPLVVIPLNGNQFNCLTEGLDIASGETIAVTVRCVNNVQLMTEKLTPSLTISYEEPDAEQAVVHFIPNNRNSGFHIKSSTVQYNDTTILAYWNGFQDKSGPLSHEMRWIPVVGKPGPWTRVEKKNFASFRLPVEAKGEHCIQVRARSIGYVYSSAINSTITVDVDPPTMTGYRPSFTWNDEKTLIVDWATVFRQYSPDTIVYEVAIGSHEGYTDIQRPIETMGTRITVEIMDDAKELYLSIFAVGPNAENSHYKTIMYL